MNVEEVLIDLGSSPLKKSNYSKVLVAFLNALLNRDPPFTVHSTGHEVLSCIYQHPDPSLQEKVLGKKLGPVRDSDPYRTTVLFFSGFVGLAIIITAVVELFNPGGGISSDGASVLEAVVEGSFGLLKVLLTP